MTPTESRVRTAYDTVAEDYARLLEGALAEAPWDLTALRAFADAVGAGPVLDAGCGTGRVTAHLHSLGVDVRGLDLSPGMLAVARRDHPGLRFEAGSLTALPDHDGVLAGVLAWYSLIHLPRAARAGVVAELHRVLAPDGHLLVAFQAGSDHVRRDQAYGHRVDLELWRLDPDELTGVLSDAGFEVLRRWDRPAQAQETTPQTALLARRRTRGGRDPGHPRTR